LDYLGEVAMSIHVLLYICAGLPLLAVFLLMMMKIVRHFFKAPMPEFMAELIDNPWRRRIIQPPDKTAIRHGIMPGMTVLEVGPGTGTYTIASARRVGDQGKVVAIDIEPKMIERVQKKIAQEEVTNIEAQVANAYDIPYENGTFDMIYMITVIGEIRSPERALREFHRVLSPGGTIAFSELFPDPDYPRASTLIRWANGVGFRVKQKIGNFFYYTLIFEKD
jgi:ubiquinone/menaquinone biosynthesis C-methylase UbiE